MHFDFIMICVIIHLLPFSGTGLFILWAGTMGGGGVTFFAVFPDPSVVSDME